METAASGNANSVRTLAVDIGGTGVKAIVLDEAGKPLTERTRIATPRPATPKALLRVIAELASKQGEFQRVSVGFPGVVRNGIPETAHNLDGKWRGFPLADRLAETLGKPIRVANDADVQGFAAITGRGVELVITLGTGLGSALFVNGILVPNLEAAHYPFRRDSTYEERLGNAALEKAGKKRWNKRVRRAIKALEQLFNFDRLFIGGGNAKKLTGSLPKNVAVVGNVAGLLGGIALWREQCDPETPSDAAGKNQS
jgi:polyphosphate glucokinase